MTKHKTQVFSTSWFNNKYYATVVHNGVSGTGIGPTVEVAVRRATFSARSKWNDYIKYIKPVLTFTSDGKWVYSMACEEWGHIRGYGKTPEEAYLTYLDNKKALNEWHDQFVQSVEQLSKATCTLSEAPSTFWSKLFNFIK